MIPPDWKSAVRWCKFLLILGDTFAFWGGYYEANALIQLFIGVGLILTRCNPEETVVT
jgi:hypothetical protein